MKETVKQKIVDLLKAKQDWIWGGQIEDYIRGSLGAKASNASRVCRILENEGIIERRLQTFTGETRRFVQYRIKPEGCCPSFQIFQTHSQDCIKLKQRIGVLL